MDGVEAMSSFNICRKHACSQLVVSMGETGFWFLVPRNLSVGSIVDKVLKPFEQPLQIILFWLPASAQNLFNFIDCLLKQELILETVNYYIM